jgi:hypothetical protein
LPGIVDQSGLDEHQIQILVSMGLGHLAFKGNATMTVRDEIAHPNLAHEESDSNDERPPDGSFKTSAFVRWFSRVDEEKIRPFLIYKYDRYFNRAVDKVH